ncbi:Xylose operon regulatory protein [Planctomycetes bacterium Poly30]|uniref:Xylose operon regulatory protein n=1 Tax=Saltatorellus ferox TaxID=2528018 RepID=A0A518EPM6_9BACT|nr:Xylose operon regulatory protein [Planctomycetes bacterium Poly30]
MAESPESQIPPRRPRVALLVESSNAYGRGLLRGMASYVRAHGSWSIQLPEMGRGGPVPDWLADWEGDGIIARIEHEEIAEAVRAKNVPTIDLSAGRLLPELPWIEVDEAAVAKVAVDHLCGRGLEHLAFCGDQRFRWSVLRGNAFEAEASKRARSLALFHAPPVDDRVTALAEWLSKLPRPLGVFACFDRVGRELLDACRMAGLLVPEEVAVLGTDDDELVCDLSDPPLSSITLNPHGTGFLAAELLGRQMAGESVSTEGHFIPPLGLVQRRSTDVLAIEDPVLARALHFIHHHACDGIRVEDVLRAASVSRRVLESRFKERLDRSPHQEILRARIERIRALLLETDLTIAEIARRTSFQHVEYMTVAFKRALGCTPTAYRQRAGDGKGRG